MNTAPFFVFPTPLSGVIEGSGSCSISPGTLLTWTVQASDDTPHASTAINIGSGPMPYGTFRYGPFGSTRAVAPGLSLHTSY